MNRTSSGCQVWKLLAVSGSDELQLRFPLVVSALHWLHMLGGAQTLLLTVGALPEAMLPPWALSSVYPEVQVCHFPPSGPPLRLLEPSPMDRRQDSLLSFVCPFPREVRRFLGWILRLPSANASPSRKIYLQFYV